MPLKWTKSKPGPSTVFHSNDCEPDWGQRLSSHEWPWGTVNKGRIKGVEVGGKHSDRQCIILVKMQTPLWLFIERFGCTQAEGMHRRQPAARPKHRASMHQAHVVTRPPRFSVVLFPESGGHLSTAPCGESLIPLVFFLFLPGYENGFSRDALTATGTSVKANKLTAFMKSVVKVCFRLTWLELERFMALQVVCRHDRAVAPLCPPTSFTALCCRLVWENFSHSEVRKHEELSESLCSKHTNASVAWNNPSLCWLFMYMQPEAFGKHCCFTFMAYETELAV